VGVLERNKRVRGRRGAARCSPNTVVLKKYERVKVK
jgi:hypothetical protein